MRLKYNESENIIEIKDELKNHYLILKVIMILNVVNALIRLIGNSITEYGVIDYFWLVIGIVSFVILYLIFIKKSTSNKINVELIKQFKEKSVFGRKRYTFELTNGKNRDLGNFKNESELFKLRELLSKIGIEN